MSEAHLEELTSMTSLWPFAVYGINLIGQLPKGRGSIQYAVVALTTSPRSFVYKNIVYRYGVPHTIVSDNDKQFDYDEFKEFCNNLQIKKVFFSVARP